MRLVALAACLLVAGCAGDRMNQERERRLAAAEAVWEQHRAACAAQFPKRVGNFANKTRCDAAAQRVIIIERGAPADFADVFLATRAVLAGQIDQGQISEEQANLQMARLVSDLTQRNLDRRNAALAAMPPPPPMPVFVPQPIIIPQQPQVQPAQRLQTTCHQFGNMMQCN
jgi:hypothetical protein